MVLGAKFSPVTLGVTIDAMSASEQLSIPRKIWTRQESDQLAALGFAIASGLELVNGDLIDRTGKSPAHVYWHTILRHWLESVFGREFVRSEAPIDVAPGDNPISEPEPDLAVTLQSIRKSAENPKPEDLRLVVEISDSTLSYDLNVKAALYARAGIVEYWVVNIPDRRLMIHNLPVNGGYVEKRSYSFEEAIRVGDASLHLSSL